MAGFEIIRGKWGEDAEKYLLAAMGGPDGLAHLKDEYDLGLIGVYFVHENARPCAAFAARIDREKDGHDFVVVAAGGNAGFDLTAVILPQICKLAKVKKCDAVRIHTKRRGLMKKIMKQGFKPEELVFRKGL